MIETILEMKNAGRSWREIGRATGQSPEAARHRWRRHRKHTPETTPYDYKSKTISGDQRIAFLTDMHVPFHSRGAIDLAVAILKDFKPTVVIVGSDGLDFYGLSGWDKSPDRKGNLQQDINIWKGLTREIQEEIKGEYIAIPGNHEDRLRRWLWTHHDIASLSVLQLKSVLGLDDMGIDLCDEIIFDNTLVIKHGSIVRKNAGYSATAELERERYSLSTLTGHTHRGALVSIKTRFDTIQGAEGFCLCNLTPEYVVNPDWQNGTVLTTVINGRTNFELVPFHSRGLSHWAYWRGNTYTS